MKNAQPAEFAPVVIKLLRGVIYYDDPSWNDLITYQEKISAFAGRIGLTLKLFESDGFAYITQEYRDEEEGDDDGTSGAGPGLPRLIRKIPLTFEVSLLCVILREELERFDRTNPDEPHLLITTEELVSRIRFYFKEKTDEIRLVRELEKYINQVEKLQYLRKTNQTDPHGNICYHVMPILKARVDLEFITLFKKRLDEYVRSLTV